MSVKRDVYRECVRIDGKWPIRKTEPVGDIECQSFRDTLTDFEDLFVYYVDREIEITGGMKQDRIEHNAKVDDVKNMNSYKFGFSKFEIGEDMEWISVDERLPEIEKTPEKQSFYSVPVIVYPGGGFAKTVIGAYYALENEDYVFVSEEGLHYENVTHWMTMPAPPEGK